ncbi:DUF2339 domain-containing protein, partial [Candidatus Parcubacteria bacterium]|nr:DUF2339 domain-containing protein [Candidatus Parcubacteria bacterium]
MSQEKDPIINRLDEISKTVVLLSEKVSSLERQINDKEKNKKEILSFYANSLSSSKLKRELPVVAPQELEKYMKSSVKKEGLNSIGRDSKIETPKKRENFEAEIGLKWLGRIGILALVFGIAFFLKYAFENDWIGETGRVAIGILSGMILIYLGDFLRQKFNAYAATLTGGGIAVLYLSIYSSFAYYQLIEQIPAFITMVIITAIGAFLAIRYEQISLAALSILGGFLTPLLLSTGIDNQIELFSYITILNLGILGISYFRNWQKLNLLGFLATIFLYIIWFLQHYDGNQLFSTLVFLTLWFVIYSVAIVSHNILYKKRVDTFDLTLIISNALVYFASSYTLLSIDYGDYMGFFAVLIFLGYNS